MMSKKKDIIFDQETLKAKYDRALERNYQNNTSLREQFKYAFPHLDASRLGRIGISNRDVSDSVLDLGRDAIYDLTLSIASRQFASKMLEYIAPVGKRWARLESIPGIEDKIPKDTLEDATRTIFSYIEQSNFYDIASRSIVDLLMGTQAYKCLEGNDENPLIFRSASMLDLALDEALDGKVRSVWHIRSDYNLSNFQVEYPTANPVSSLKDKMSSRSESEKNRGTVLIDGWIYIEESGKYQHVLYHNTVNEENLMLNAISPSTPWIVSRFNKYSDSPYGYGPITQATIPAIVLNTLLGRMTQKAAVDAASVIFRHERNAALSIPIKPLSVVNVRDGTNLNDVLSRLNLGTESPATLGLLETYRRSIYDILFQKPLGPAEKPLYKTATETEFRVQEFLDSIGPVHHRNQDENISPQIKRIIYILERKNLLNIGGKNSFRVAIESPLTRRQDELDWKNIGVWMSEMLSLLGPSFAPILVKLPAFIAKSRELNNIPNAIGNSKDDMVKLLQSFQESVANQANDGQPPGQLTGGQASAMTDRFPGAGR